MRLIRSYFALFENFDETLDKFQKNEQGFAINNTTYEALSKSHMKHWIYYIWSTEKAVRLILQIWFLFCIFWNFDKTLDKFKKTAQVLHIVVFESLVQFSSFSEFDEENSQISLKFDANRANI